MALNIYCGSKGINGGTIDCAPVPGVGTYLIVWGGKATAANIAAGYNTVKGVLVADSKKSKNDGSKLMVFPIIRELTPKKEANTEASLADGTKQVTREGSPAYELKIKTDSYLVTQLRKLNNRNIRYAIVDDKNQMWCYATPAGEVTGRAGKLFTDGIDVHGFSNVDGESMVLLQADNAYETYDFPACIELDKAPVALFSYLKDVQLYEKATAVSNVIKISGKMVSPNPLVVVDMYSDYSASAFTTNSSLWYCKDKTGATVTLSVAPNASGYVDVTLNSTNHTAALSGDTFEIGLVNPTALDAANVVGIEGTAVIYTKP